MSRWLVLAALLTPFYGRAESANLLGDWPTYGNGPAHTGYFPGTLNGLPFVLKWKVPMPNFNTLQPVIGNGRLFLTVGWYYGPMSIRALDASTGQGLWTNNFATAQTINPPTYDQGAVYVQRSTGATPSDTWSFNETTGATNWSSTFTSQGYSYMAPVVANGSVYVGTGYYSDFTGYNRTNGAVRFSFASLGVSDEWGPAYYRSNVYTWTGGFFIEYNPLTGARNWIVTNASQGSSQRSVALADGRAYLTGSSKLIAIDLGLHTNAWEISGSFSGTPAVANGKVYAISNGVVCAYTTNGTYVNTFTGTNGSSFSGQLIVTDDALVVAGSYGVYVFKLTDGTVQQYITSYRLPCGCYYSSKISLANNTLYIASGDSFLDAYSASNLWKFVVRSSGAPYGSPSPHPYGTNYVLGDSVVTNRVISPISGPTGTRYLVTGWTGTGSVPASGTTNFVSFVATSESTLTWNFKTQYFLDTSVTSAGTVDVADAWFDSGTNVTITATPSAYYHFVNWSGDASGTSNIFQLPMNGPRNVTANFAANVVTNDVPEWWLAQYNLPISDAGALADTDGDEFANWKEFRAGTNPKDAASALRLTALPPPPWNPTQLILTWPSAYGRTYRLLSTTNLGNGFSLLFTNIYANPPFNYAYLNIGNTNWSFYLIQIE